LSFLFSPHTRIRILVNTLMAREQRIFHVEALRTRDHGTYWLIDFFLQVRKSETWNVYTVQQYIKLGIGSPKDLFPFYEKYSSGSWKPLIG
jgi:hypothetical protein